MILFDPCLTPQKDLDHECHKDRARLFFEIKKMNVQ